MLKNVRYCFFKYAAPLWRWYVAAILALTATTMITLEVPRLAKSIVNELNEGQFIGAREAAFLIIGLGIAQLLIRALSRILFFWPGRRIEESLKNNIFGDLIRLPMRKFLEYSKGDLISRLSNDVGQIRVFFAFGLLQVANFVLLLSFIISEMFSIHPTLAVAALAPLSLMVLISRLVLPKMHQFSREAQRSIGELTQKITEGLVNVHVVKANACEKVFANRSEVENQKVYLSNMKLIYVRTLMFPSMYLISGLSQVSLILYGGYEALQGSITVGDILAFDLYLGLLTFPLTAVGMILAMLQKAETAGERVMELGKIENEKRLTTSGESRGFPEETAFRVDVKNLEFSYSDEPDGFALKNISLTISERKRVGIYGRVGAGKTTLFNLLTRLYEPPESSIFVNGVDVLKIDKQKLRNMIGLGLQANHLFSATIRENLMLGVPDSRASLVELAAKSAAVWDDIHRFPHRWDTEIGEKGVRLSGGQKQRICLARLLLRNYKLLVLDDVLSAVDQVTEQHILNALFSRPTPILIASNRESVLERCDEVIILEKGSVTLRGTFSETKHAIGATS